MKRALNISLDSTKKQIMFYPATSMKKGIIQLVYIVFKVRMDSTLSCNGTLCPYTLYNPQL